MKENKYFRVSSLFLLLILLLLCSNTAFTQTDDSLYYTNPDYHVAKELFNRRIVMLGDYSHHQPGPYKHVYDVLENWLNICESKNESVKLTYIIEKEDAVASEINNFFTTGDLMPIIDKTAPEFYLIDLEYYTQLRKFFLKVDSVNQTRKNKISFIIKGFEEIGSVNFEKMAIKPQRESELWFINERDSISAKGIIDYMKSNPDEQILMFYGNGHLQQGLVNKNIGFNDLTEKEGMGYWLVHYLKKEFGNESVITFSTITYLEHYLKNPELDSIKHKDFITRPININNPEFRSEDVDYFFSCHSDYIPQLEGFHIYSKYIFDKIHYNLKIVKNWLPGYKATLYYNWYLGTISEFCNNKFLDDEELEEWLNKNTFDGIDLLYTNKLTDTFANQFVQKHDKNFINSIISRYGIAFTIIDSDMINFEKWKDNELPQILRHIKFTNSIGIYWLGYPDEKIKAKEYLVQFSGEDFAEPEKYLQWYRMKYFGFDY